MKTVFVLIWPKGSGKSYIGKLIEKKLSVRFLSVEPFFIKAKGGRGDLDENYFTDAWNMVGDKISELLQRHDKVSIESIGTFDSFRIFLRRLQSEYNVKLVQVKAPLDLCTERIRKRKSSSHVPMQEELIDRINKMAISEKYTFDISIDNCRMSNEEILQEFKRIL